MPDQTLGTDAGPQARVEHELTRLARRIRAALSAYAPVVHPRLDVAGYTLLLAIVDAERDGTTPDVRVAALADRLRLHKSTLSRGLARLERLGLVQRVADPQDRRARLVRLSPDGADRVARVRAERLAGLAQVLGGWPVADLVALADLLQRLNTTLDDAPPRPTRPPLSA